MLAVEPDVHGSADRGFSKFSFSKTSSGTQTLPVGPRVMVVGAAEGLLPTTVVGLPVVVPPVGLSVAVGDGAEVVPVGVRGTMLV